MDKTKKELENYAYDKENLYIVHSSGFASKFAKQLITNPKQYSAENILYISWVEYTWGPKSDIDRSINIKTFFERFHCSKAWMEDVHSKLYDYLDNYIVCINENGFKLVYVHNYYYDHGPIIHGRIVKLDIDKIETIFSIQYYNK